MLSLFISKIGYVARNKLDTKLYTFDTVTVIFI